MKIAELKSGKILVRVLAEDNGAFWCRSLIGRRYFTVMSSDLRVLEAEGTATLARDGEVARGKNFSD